MDCYDKVVITRDMQSANVWLAMNKDRFMITCTYQFRFCKAQLRAVQRCLDSLETLDNSEAVSQARRALTTLKNAIMNVCPDNVVAVPMEIDNPLKL